MYMYVFLKLVRSNDQVFETIIHMLSSPLTLFCVYSMHSQYSIPSFALLQTVQDQRTSCSLCVTSMQTIRGATTKHHSHPLSSKLHISHVLHTPYTSLTPSTHTHTLLTHSPPSHTPHFVTHTPSQHIFREPVCASMPNGVNLCTLCLMDGEPVYASMPNGVNLCTLCLMDGEPVYGVSLCTLCLME